jgi:hypothetical protein
MTGLRYQGVTAVTNPDAPQVAGSVSSWLCSPKASRLGAVLRDWRPVEVLRALDAAGHSAFHFAMTRDFNCLFEVGGKGAAEARIAEMIGERPSDIWPSRYNQQGNYSRREFMRGNRRDACPSNRPHIVHRFQGLPPHLGDGFIGGDDESPVWRAYALPAWQYLIRHDDNDHIYSSVFMMLYGIGAHFYRCTSLSEPVEFQVRTRTISKCSSGVQTWKYELASVSNQSALHALNDSLKAVLPAKNPEPVRRARRKVAK